MNDQDTTGAKKTPARNASQTPGKKRSGTGSAIAADATLTKEVPVLRFRTAYDPTYDPLEYATVVDPQMPTRTKGYFKDSCDVNKILERYYETGVVEHVQTHGGTYGECTSVDFKEAMDLVTRAQEMFDDLPAKARAEFNNDPAKFLDFASDLTEADVPKLIELEMLETGSITHRNFMEGERRRRELQEVPSGASSDDPDPGTVVGETPT